MPAKLKRQTRIKELLQTYIVANQEELLHLLKAEGFHITQATLSRDFAELGVIRVNSDGHVRYLLDADESGKHIARLVGFEILSVQFNEAMIVIRTLAGRAQGVAHFIDRLNREDIIGTVGGDDTVLLIPNKVENIASIVAFIKKMMYKVPSY
ncbi:MAG: arginine repressor [Ignavibacteria bacterium]|nr:arginine repressor [Ignavibacteria bacterium]